LRRKKEGRSKWGGMGRTIHQGKRKRERRGRIWEAISSQPEREKKVALEGEETSHPGEGGKKEEHTSIFCTTRDPRGEREKSLPLDLLWEDGGKSLF